MQTPYGKVYDAIWALLESSTEFTALFPAGNRIKYGTQSDADRQPAKVNQQSADTPEAMLIAMGGPIEIGHTSSTTKITQNFDLVINTGDYRLNEYIFPIAWIVTCKGKEWCQYLASLQWRGTNYVKVVRITNSTIGESPERRSRGIKGWSSVMTFSVEMHFDTVQQLQIADIP